MIDYELVNNTIAVYCAVGILLIIVLVVVGVTLFVYYGLKINKIDDDNFKKRVKSIIKEKDLN